MEEKPADNPSSETQMPQTSEPALNVEMSEKKEDEIKTYLKAMPLRDLAELENIKSEVKGGNIIILKITPLANKNINDVSQAVNQLFSFAEEIGGDIARLGEERIVLCPPKIRIWREKASVKTEPLPTAA